jgi:hypothetical protein
MFNVAFLSSPSALLSLFYYYFALSFSFTLHQLTSVVQSARQTPKKMLSTFSILLPLTHMSGPAITAHGSLDLQQKIQI